MRQRKSLKRVYVLVDSRHGLKVTDVEFMDRLETAKTSFQVCKWERFCERGGRGERERESTKEGAKFCVSPERQRERESSICCFRWLRLRPCLLLCPRVCLYLCLCLYLRLCLGGYKDRACAEWEPHILCAPILYIYIYSIFVYIYRCVHTYMYIIYMYMYICMCIYIHVFVYVLCVPSIVDSVTNNYVYW